MIGSLMLIGFVTAYIGLVVVLPLIGHATWHAYRETVKERRVACDGPLPDARYKEANPDGLAVRLVV